MEVGSSSLPGTTHRTISAMCAGSVDVAFIILWMTVLSFTISLKPFIGGLAQLARALAWHARGHRFDPDILHFALDLRMRSLTY